MTGAAVPLVAILYLLALACTLLGARDRDALQVACGIFVLACLTYAIAR